MKILFLAFLFSVPAHAYEVASLKYSPSCIFTAVAERMQVTRDDAIPFPPLHLESKTPLKQFQDAIEPQWNLRPDVFLNAYIIATNEIYLLDEAAYYNKARRFIDDSLAHELVHYVQVKYKYFDLKEDETGEFESEAVDVQTWFRETFMETGKSPCGGNQ